MTRNRYCLRAARSCRQMSMVHTHLVCTLKQIARFLKIYSQICSKFNGNDDTIHKFIVGSYQEGPWLPIRQQSQSGERSSNRQDRIRSGRVRETRSHSRCGQCIPEKTHARMAKNRKLWKENRTQTLHLSWEQSAPVLICKLIFLKMKIAQKWIV